MANIVKLQSSDGGLFDVPVDVARLCKKVKSSLGDPSRNEDDKKVIQVDEVSSAVLRIIIDWMTYHRINNTLLDSWDTNFVNEQDPGTLFELLLAAKYLEIESLLDLVGRRVFSMVAPTLSNEQIRQNFGVTADLTDGEVHQIKEENEWCLQKRNPIN